MAAQELLLSVSNQSLYFTSYQSFPTDFISLPFWRWPS